MTDSPLEARIDLVGRAFAAPQDDLNRAMRRFLRDMKQAEDEYRTEVAAQRETLKVPAEYSDTPDVERYSLAVQIFAAMTIEAGISFYAVMRFGGDPHDDHFRWGSMETRLKEALRHAHIEIADDNEIIEVLHRRKVARDRIVHPFSAEYDEPTSSDRKPDRAWPDCSAAEAHRAVADVDRFFALLRDLDASTSFMLHMF
jgi:hypothetical protein